MSDIYNPSSGGGAPTGNAGGILSGTYPNPGFADAGSGTVLGNPTGSTGTPTYTGAPVLSTSLTVPLILNSGSSTGLQLQGNDSLGTTNLYVYCRVGVTGILIVDTAADVTDFAMQGSSGVQGAWRYEHRVAQLNNSNNTLGEYQALYAQSAGVYSTGPYFGTIVSAFPNAGSLTNPILLLDSSTASAVTGINIKSAASGGGVVISTTSTAASENITIAAKVNGVAAISSPTTVTSISVGNTVAQVNVGGVKVVENGGWYCKWLRYNISATTNHRYAWFNAADTNLTASTENHDAWFDLGFATRQHATGALTLQRDFRVTGTPHSFVGASTITDLAAFAIDNYAQAGTNATITNAHGLYIPTQAVAGTVTNASAMTLNTPTGAGTANYALWVQAGNIFLGAIGSGFIIKSGTNARIGVGTLSGGTVAVANTSVTANTRVFLTDTSGSVVNVGSLTVVTSAGVGFTVTSTNAIDVSTFNWMLVESA